MTTEQSMIHVGIDVSKDKLAVAIAGGGVRDEVLSLGTFENAPASVDRLLKNLAGRGSVERNATERHDRLTGHIEALVPEWDLAPAVNGLVPLTFRSLNSFMRPFVRRPRGFCHLASPLLRSRHTG